MASSRGSVAGGSGFEELGGTVAVKDEVPARYGETTFVDSERNLTRGQMHLLLVTVLVEILVTVLVENFTVWPSILNSYGLTPRKTVW